ncbi:MAG: hypothetical protein JOY60_15025 [Burkholderiaceae bacterium]|nr:hypothetical protein [Roseateles sp.]MBV8471161.1 hypothetical protein [Burkholderiaceae bacterium]
MSEPKELISAAAIAQMPWQEKTHLLNSNAVRLAKPLGAGKQKLGAQW